MELLPEGACLHVEDLQARYRGLSGDDDALFRQDARLLVFDVSEAIVSGALVGDDPIATATMKDVGRHDIPWSDALQGAPAAFLNLGLSSGVTISLRSSRATLGFEGEGTLQNGKRAWDPSSQLEMPRPWRKEGRESTSPFRHGVPLPLSSM